MSVDDDDSGELSVSASDSDDTEALDVARVLIDDSDKQRRIVHSDDGAGSTNDSASGRLHGTAIVSGTVLVVLVE